MPPAARPRRHPTDDGSQLRLLSASPEQEIYELLRPIVQFGQPPAARARETGVPERTLRGKAARFDANRMRSFFEWNGIRPSADNTIGEAGGHIGGNGQRQVGLVHSAGTGQRQQRHALSTRQVRAVARSVSRPMRRVRGMGRLPGRVDAAAAMSDVPTDAEMNAVHIVPDF
jgi:hypothetical protein